MLLVQLVLAPAVAPVPAVARAPAVIFAVAAPAPPAVVLLAIAVALAPWEHRRHLPVEATHGAVDALGPSLGVVDVVMGQVCQLPSILHPPPGSVRSTFAIV